MAFATGALGDHGDLLTNRNLAADRAERATAAFLETCGSTGCDLNTINTTDNNGTVLTGCLHTQSDAVILEVQGELAWNPRVLRGLTPASGQFVSDLSGLARPAVSVIPPC